MKRAHLMIVAFGFAAGGVGGITAATAQPPVAAADLPTVEAVSAAAVKAIGGAEALAKIQTLHTVMTVNMTGQDMEMDSSWSRKGGRITTVKTPAGDTVMGTDGTVNWVKQGEIYRLMPESMVGRAGSQAAMHMSTLDPTCRDKDEVLAVVGKEKFQDKDCYKLSYASKRRGSGFAFFDIQTGLPVGAIQNAEPKSTSILGDWKKVDGVLFFHAVKIEGGQRGGELKVVKIEINKPDESAFALPDEVKKLVPDKAPDAAPAAAIKLEELPKEQQAEAKQAVESLGKMPDVKSIKQMLQGVEMGMSQMPPERKKMMEYLAQEMKAEIKKRGG